MNLKKLLTFGLCLSTLGSLFVGCDSTVQSDSVTIEPANPTSENSTNSNATDPSSATNNNESIATDNLTAGQTSPATENPQPIIESSAPKIVEEVRTEPMEIHVYSSEIPWLKDSNPNSMANHEFTSINAALSSTIEGDTLIIHEGIYREVVNIKKDNITLKAAPGEYVLVSGNELVSGFVPEPSMPGVYVADVPSNYKTTTLPFTQVFANGHYQNIARFPNYTIDDMMAPLEEGSGYAWLNDIYKPQDTTIGSVTFRDYEIPNVDLTGATFRGLIGKNSEYVYGTVTSTKDNTIEFDAYSKNNWQKATEIKPGYHDFGFGYVLHKNLLDIPGEWFVENEKIYYMPTDDINNLQIELQVRKDVLMANNVDNLTIEGINFVAGNAPISNVENLLIDKCTFRYMQPFQMTTTYSTGAFVKTGLAMDNVKNATIQNSYFAHTWSHGIHVASGNNITLQNCTIEDIGWSGTFNAGFYSAAQNNLVKDCTFRDSGRFHTRVNEPVKIDIIHCLFERPMKLGEDSGAIAFANTTQYSYNMQDSEIAYNIIRDFDALPISSMNNRYNNPFIVAMYLEEMHNYTVHHNLIYDLIDYDYLENFTAGDTFKSATWVYFSPRHKSLDEKIHFYNNTAWNYLNNFHIYNIEIANYDEIDHEKLNYSHHHGRMVNGHFANNLFDTAYSNLSHAAKTFTLEGKDGPSYKLSSEENQSLKTQDLNAFFEHAAKNDYLFNPEANMILNSQNEIDKLNYVDVETGNFRLAEDSPAKGAGIAIPGITSSDNPDLGALEGSDYVLSAGSRLELPAFKEMLVD
ncbi:MAG: hypothetical protein ATN31_02400 [Candidatus Epulonipiscioides saccharophilum]|nr:MAG: hypothetical protein ATN31_02400 [Epulopiscium sp. AS2M-Bin001]